MLPSFSLVALVAGASAHSQPDLTLQFYAEIHASNGYGHDGDGCVPAEQQLVETPTISKVWFDQPGQRLAQTNPDLWAPGYDPQPNLTVVGLFADDPPTELDLDPTAPDACYTEPLPPGFCPNGTAACPASFGDFGFGNLNALTSILGSNYYNTSLVDGGGPDEDLWRWVWTEEQLVPLENGTVVEKNITRNYTLGSGVRTSLADARGGRGTTSPRRSAPTGRGRSRSSSGPSRSRWNRRSPCTATASCSPTRRITRRAPWTRRAGSRCRTASTAPRPTDRARPTWSRAPRPSRSASFSFPCRPR